MKIQRWNIGLGGVDELKVTVSCTSDSAFWAFLEWLWEEWQTWLCHILGFIPLPGPLVRWKGAWGEKEDYAELPALKTPFGEWYGDSLGDLWHLFVCDPVCQFIWPHLDRHSVSFEMTVEEARAKLAHYPELLKWVEKEVQERPACWGARGEANGKDDVQGIR